MADILQFISENIIGILGIILGSLSLLYTFYRFHTQSRKIEGMEAIQASFLPSFDIEISTKVEKHSVLPSTQSYRILLIDITIHNVGKVMARPIFFGFRISSHNPFIYPDNNLTFNGMNDLPVFFRAKLQYKDLHKVKVPDHLKEENFIIYLDEDNKELIRYDGVQSKNNFHNYIAPDKILGYNYHVGEHRHFNFPIIISGHGIFNLMTEVIFIREKYVKPERFLKKLFLSPIRINFPRKKFPLPGRVQFDIRHSDTEKIPEGHIFRQLKEDLETEKEVISNWIEDDKLELQRLNEQLIELSIISKGQEIRDQEMRSFKQAEINRQINGITDKLKENQESLEKIEDKIKRNTVKPDERTFKPYSIYKFTEEVSKHIDEDENVDPNLELVLSLFAGEKYEESFHYIKELSDKNDYSKILADLYWKYGLKLWGNLKPNLDSYSRDPHIQTSSDKIDDYRKEMTIFLKKCLDQLFESQSYFEKAFKLDPNRIVGASGSIFEDFYDNKYKSYVESLEKTISNYREEWIQQKVLLQSGEQFNELFPVLTPIAIEIANDLDHLILSADSSDLNDKTKTLINELREEILVKYGIKIPGIRFRANDALTNGDYNILSFEIVEGTSKTTLGGNKIPSTNKIEKIFRHLQILLENSLHRYLYYYEVLRLLDENKRQLNDIYNEFQSNPEEIFAFSVVLKEILRRQGSIRSFNVIASEFYKLRRESLALSEIKEKILLIPELEIE
ncbi:MAG: hypothetical protein ACFFDN_22170 [Candidatus Hodarchaeota archaeon]